MVKLNTASVEEIVADIVNNDSSESCYFILDKRLFQRLAFEDKLYLLSDGLSQKRKLPVNLSSTGLFSGNNLGNTDFCGIFP